jgi:hypothetical protein
LTTSAKHTPTSTHLANIFTTVGKLIFGSGGSQEALVELPQGQLYLVRPLSPKGYSELIFKDAAARIRRTAQEFHYQLVVQRVYEEGEAELLAEEEGEDAEIDALASERDEKTFLLDEALRLRFEIRDGTEKAIAWSDLSGDSGDVYEFVCDSSVASSLVTQFERVARQCQYERKYRKPHSFATEEDLASFEPAEETPIPPASPLHGPSRADSILSSSGFIEPVPSIEAALASGLQLPPHQESREDIDEDEDDDDDDFQDAHVEHEEPDVDNMTKANTSAKRSATPEAATSLVPVADEAPEALTEYASEHAELHFYDHNAGAFVSQEDEVTVIVTEVGKWKYWLHVKGKDKTWLGLPIVAEINPVFNFEYLSFIFNHFAPDGSVYSWLLRFKDFATLEKFQEALLRCLWEQLNEIKWEKVKQKDQDYITEAFGDLAMDDVPEEEEEEEERYEEEEEEEVEQEADEDEEEQEDDNGNINSQLAVGYKNNRTFVIRGDKIGVFAHGDNDSLKFSTTINKVQTPGGKAINPKKVMLHNEDRDMVMQHLTDPHKLYRMDLEYGKVVDEWNVHDDIPVVSFAPEEKFAQLTAHQPFLGISHNALFRIDPREADNKLDGEKLKMYATKNDFSAAATTEKGHIAVASNKGDIRLFDRLGINAKTHIPGLGEPIIGVDLSADGRWVLATCRTYLLLIDAMQKGKNEGKLGFEKSFAADSKPQPRRLALSPEHLAQVAHETKQGVSFTPAKFNTGADAQETSIITATGPYIVEWNLKKIVKGVKNPYLIKRYREEVKADDFKFGSDKNIIVALPNEINMVGKQSLKKPTRESIAGDFLKTSAAASRRAAGKIGSSTSGRYKLGKEDVVESPY